MAALQTGYQALLAYNDNEAETPQDSEVMIHVVPESGKSRWNHIEDLDSFFTRIYVYHQRHGFRNMVLDDFWQLIKMMFIIMFIPIIYQCVDYPVLFKNVPPRGRNYTDKVHLSDVFIPLGVCIPRLNKTFTVFIILAIVVWIFRLLITIYHILQYYEIKVFYSTALKIPPEELDNMTWHEVQCQLLEVQREQQMCIHKSELSELDIYHRILRFKNYMVAMVNKNILSVKVSVPLLGEMTFLTKGVRYNLELILFRSPYAPFQNSWHLREDYKRAAKRKQLAKELSKHILWIGFVNFLLCPLIFCWQILYYVLNHLDLIKREPSIYGSRTWSMYGRLYLRHFNELDHELNARLSRAYKPAKNYMQIFISHTMANSALSILYMASTIGAYLLLLTIYDEDVLTVEHILSIITAMGVIVAICRSIIPDENTVWCPEKLMTNILAHIHYIPDHWRGKAHTSKVRDEFSQLFQYKGVHILEELFSPIITPIILCFYLRHRALDIVDFFRNFTVDVVGVGDVCSFAQMDVRQHGNVQWMSEGHTEANQYQQAEDGKTELSLVHFTLTNPNWVPPEESSIYLNNLREQAIRDVGRLHMMPEENALYYSLNSVSSLGGEYTDLVNSILQCNNPDPAVSTASLLTRSVTPSIFIPHTPRETVPKVVGGIAQKEGPLHISSAGLLSSLHSTQKQRESQESASLYVGASQNMPLEYTAANMSISTLYMHGLHFRQLRQNSTAPRIGHPSVIWQRPLPDMPGIIESPQEYGAEGEERIAENQPLLTDMRIVRSS